MSDKLPWYIKLKIKECGTVAEDGEMLSIVCLSVDFVWWAKPFIYPYFFMIGVCEWLSDVRDL
jgi:hypothetical protein